MIPEFGIYVGCVGILILVVFSPSLIVYAIWIAICGGLAYVGEA